MAEQDFLQTPVIFIIFNRPDVTQKVFEQIRQAKPSQLLVIADGPRENKPGEAEKCQKTRSIIEQVDWDCQVFKNYSDVNLGCQKRVSSGLDWAFELVEEAMILEDDCLPHSVFFTFCNQLLEYYRNDQRIMVISGANYQLGNRRTEYSYYISRFNHCWGWATWRRAWKLFDFNMTCWPEIRDADLFKDLLIDMDLDTDAIKYWYRIFQSTYAGEQNSWAYRWTFACWIHSGLTIIPNTNLISNLGFSPDATHTSQANHFAELALGSLSFPLQHPPYIIPHVKADIFTQLNHFYKPGIRSVIKRKLKALFLPSYY